MCRGDGFSGVAPRDLAAHPTPALAQLVLIGEGIRGYSVKGGRALGDHAGRIEPIKPDESLGKCDGATSPSPSDRSPPSPQRSAAGADVLIRLAWLAPTDPDGDRLVEPPEKVERAVADR